MKGLPKKYAKMGFKKGWRAYKNTRKTPKVRTMARRKKGRTVVRYVKKKYRKARSGLTMRNIIKVLIGAGMAAVYEVFVSPMIPVAAMMRNIIELGVGLFLAAAPRMPMPIRAFGAALATINAYSIAVPYIANLGGGAAGNSGSAW